MAGRRGPLSRDGNAEDVARRDVQGAIRSRIATAMRCPDHLRTDSPFWPHLVVAVGGIRERSAAMPDALRQRLANAFLRSLASRLDLAARQVAVFECAVERQLFPGSSIRTVADLAVACQRDPTPLADLLDSYPALDNLLTDHVASAIRYAEKVAGALVRDWPEVVATLADRPGSPLASIGDIEVLPSDAHGGGETVVVVRDDAGRSLMAYKPRCVRLEATMTRALARLAAQHDVLGGWRLPRYVPRRGYGWVEWIEPEPCAKPDDVGRYYVRAGALLGWSVALGVTDLHRDNLISHVDCPVPIDLETSLHHRQRPGAASRRGMVLPRVMEWNGLATGLLPMWIWKGEDRSGVDLSGLGSLGEQWCSLPLQQFVERDTPFERMVRDGVRLFPGRNTLRLGNDEVAPWRYIEEILAGYGMAIELITRSGGYVPDVVDEAAGLEARFLARPTAGYHYAIQASLHPVYARDLERRRGFLREALSDTTRIEEWLLASEVEACLRGDIPRFVTTGAGRSIREVRYGAEGMLSEDEHVTGAQAVLDDLSFLATPARLAFERRLISGAMLSLQSAYEQPVRPPESRRRGQPPAAHRRLDFRATAVASAVKFLLDYVHQQDDPDLWYGFREAPGGHYEFGLIGSDFYSGASGVAYALGLGFAAGVVPADVVERATTAVAAAVRRRLGELEHRLGGAYFGELSAVLPLAANLVTLGRPAEGRLLAGAALDALARAVAGPRPARHFWGMDLLGGAAGALAVGVSLYRYVGDAEWLPVIASLVSLLDAGGQQVGAHVVWSQPAVSVGPDAGLCGLSHGQAGCALALAEAASLDALPDAVRRRAAQLARQAVGWELARFCPEVSNFPDFRHRATSPREGEVAWSHGVLGTLCALHRIRACIEAPEVERFVAHHPVQEIVDQVVSHRRSPINPSLCHGALGIYLLTWTLLRAENHPGEVGGLDRLAEWTDLVGWAEFETRPLREHAIAAPGFMVGRAGSLAGWLSAGAARPEAIPFLPHVFEERGRVRELPGPEPRQWRP